MKKIILFLLLAPVFCFAQQSSKKIKIILLGTFHFNQSLDSSSKLHSNLFTDKRQKEVNDIVMKLAAQKPDKIFLEFTEKNQPYYDSIYTDYLKGQEPKKNKDKANEFFQLGMKAAKKLGHTKIHGMNYQPQELADSSFEPKNNIEALTRDLYLALGNYEDSTRANAEFYDMPYPYRLPKLDSLLQKSTLSNFLIYLNSKTKLQRDEYVNWNFFLSVGTGSDMTFSDYVGNFWYGTNLRNYNNVLRKVDYKNDNCYLIIYGSSHVPILKYFFEMNPFFEVVDINKVLK